MLHISQHAHFLILVKSVALLLRSLQSQLKVPLLETRISLRDAHIVSSIGRLFGRSVLEANADGGSSFGRPPLRFVFEGTSSQSISRMLISMIHDLFSINFYEIK